MERGRGFNFDEILAAVPTLSPVERTRLADALKTSREVDPVKAEAGRIIEEAALLVNKEVGATMSDDVPIRDLNIGAVPGSQHEEAVRAYLTLIDSLPKRAATTARRTTNCVIRGGVSTLGGLRGAEDAKLLEITNFGSLSLKFARLAFAKPKSPESVRPV